ncbi:DUF2179 domain-containing protein [Paenibacillus sp. Soil522]|uniref:DUF2179 domain-containing protein n=1 Tax=Paenibacillus sp. Soil522 TaxID=1736388 RepID=UPI003FA6FF23
MEDIQRIIIMTVLNPLKVNKLKSIIQEIDPHSFIIVCDATEVFGQGFSELVTSQNPKS